MEDKVGITYEELKNRIKKGEPILIDLKMLEEMKCTRDEIFSLKEENEDLKKDVLILQETCSDLDLKNKFARARLIISEERNNDLERALYDEEYRNFIIQKDKEKRNDK